MIKEFYKKRREKLFASMQDNSVAFIQAAKNVIRSRDVYYPFRQDSNFLYLTGFIEPQAWAVFIKEGTNNKFVLFTQTKNPVIELWEGLRIGQEKACSEYGADEAYPLSELDEKMAQYICHRSVLYYSFFGSESINHSLKKWVSSVKKAKREDGILPYSIRNIDYPISELRLIKDEHEIQCIRKAVEITLNGHHRAARKITAGIFEYELEGELLGEFHSAGGCAAYTSIVGSGANACILHYTQNNKKLLNGDLVLIDAGAEYQGYAADITRTYPINGTFNPTQLSLYEVVLEAQKLGIECIKPGIKWTHIQDTIVASLVKGLIRIGILKGNVKELIEQKAYSKMYPHSSGHWLGLDVHDVGLYQKNYAPRTLEPGMVLTVEPGLYLSKEMKEIDTEWHGLGIRIEDDILVTERGYEIISKAIPKEPSDIARWVKEK